MPRPGDTKQTVQNKVDTIKQLIIDNMTQKLNFYKAGGYNIGALPNILDSMTTHMQQKQQLSANAPGPDQSSQNNARQIAAKTIDARTSKLGSTTPNMPQGQENSGTAQAPPPPSSNQFMEPGNASLFAKATAEQESRFSGYPRSLATLAPTPAPAPSVTSNPLEDNFAARQLLENYRRYGDFVSPLGRQ
jgi:hypothetical protein